MLALEDMIRGQFSAARFLTRECQLLLEQQERSIKKKQELDYLSPLHDFCISSCSMRKMTSLSGPGVCVWYVPEVIRAQGG